ncbi:hypothetical protein IF1G_09985 [Cordyceps javanica]|uniref:Uncharacterized protein n=1 Tax=Cordyceps javanica TaxID=43265 RepID=A0A545UPU8_9HYPO|nr:hypothetical protein IF1G_09985 [Cordyceps javanica]
MVLDQGKPVSRKDETNLWWCGRWWLLCVDGCSVSMAAAWCFGSQPVAMFTDAGLAVAAAFCNVFRSSFSLGAVESPNGPASSWAMQSRPRQHSVSVGWICGAGSAVGFGHAPFASMGKVQYGRNTEPCHCALR